MHDLQIHTSRIYQHSTNTQNYVISAPQHAVRTSVSKPESMAKPNM